MQIKELITKEDIAKSFDAFLELRPHLHNVDTFIASVIDQQKAGYSIWAILEHEEVVACIGFRIMRTLAWGKILYVDDLITKETCRGKGYGNALLKYATKIAKDNQCLQVHLDTGYTRHAAHKVYLNQGFEFICHHLALNLDK